MGGESLTIVSNTLENVNVSFEASLFTNVKVFEINVFSAAIQFVDCLFLLSEEQSSLNDDAAKSFISIIFSNLLYNS